MESKKKIINYNNSLKINRNKKFLRSIELFEFQKFRYHFMLFLNIKNSLRISEYRKQRFQPLKMNPDRLIFNFFYKITI